MLLRIEVFPQAGKGGSAEGGTPKPSQTLYASPATGANRRKLLDGGNNGNNDNNNADDDDDATADENDNKNDSKNDSKNDPNAGLVATIGRKGNVDILFGADRSISRQHALLRFVAAPRPHVGAKPKGRRTTRGKKAGDIEKEHEHHATAAAAVPRGCFMEPRNDDERSACDDTDSNPYGMCLVLENKGKSGSYIASVDESIQEEEKDVDGEDKEPKDDANDSDATTDDEGDNIGGNNPSTTAFSSSQRNSNSMYGTATSLATQTGEILLSKKTLSPSQTLPSLSAAIRHHFGTHTPVQLTTIGADESQVLEFFGDTNNGGDDDDDDDTNNTTAAFSSNPSILIQFGCALLPTIKITLLPMTVVFSSGVPLSIQNSLRLCGGVQEVGTLPRRETKDNKSRTTTRTRATTHLVAPERMAVAKQLIAWCYGVPIVSPDFLVALHHHSALTDPFPHPTDFPATTATDKNAFWEWTPDPHLLSRYTMISVDPSPEVEQAEGLATAAGAKLERLYDPQKKHTKAKVKSFLKHAKGLLEDAIGEATTTKQQQQQQQQQQQVVLLSSKVKSKWSNANTTLLLKQLKEELLIPSASSKILAKTITKQVSELVGLESSASGTTNSSNSNSSSNKGRSKDKTMDPPISSKETVLADTDPPPATNGNDDSPQSPEQERPQKKERPNLKRERKESSAEEPMNSKMQMFDNSPTNFGDGHCHDDEGNNNEVEGIPPQSRSQSRSQSQSSKRRKVDHQEQQQRQQSEYNPPSDDIDPVGSISTSSSSNRKPHSTNTRKTNSSNGQTEFEFGRGDANGWFQAAPKDDRERSRLRQRASEAYQKETGIELESSASTNSGDPRIYVVIPTNGGGTNDRADAVGTNHRHHHRRRQNNTPNPNLPNFKRFRKNLVPRADASDEVVVLLDAALSHACQAPQEPNAEERQLQEHQKLAEALFKGDMVPGMVKKMRRVRK